MDLSPFREFGSDGRSTGGSMNNQMYRNIRAFGVYEPKTGRCKKRKLMQTEGICLNKNKKFWDF